MIVGWETFVEILGRPTVRLGTIITDAAGRSLADMTEVERRVVETGAHELARARWCGLWAHTDPCKSERDVRAALRGIAAAKAALKALDVGARSRIDGALVTLAMGWAPAERWPDFGALEQLGQLEQTLAAVSEDAKAAASWRATGSTARGRRPDRVPYDVALAAARIYRRLSGKAPTYRTGGETPYGKMLRALFAELAIDADARRPAEWAIGQN